MDAFDPADDCRECGCPGGGHNSGCTIGHAAEIARLRAKLDALRAALAEIAKGEGPFKIDPLAHAASCIDNMKSIATRALNEQSAAFDAKAWDEPKHPPEV